MNITVADIKRDLTKFVKDFPVEIIPHQTDEELKQKMQKSRLAIKAAVKRNPKLHPHERAMSNHDFDQLSTGSGGRVLSVSQGAGVRPRNANSFSTSLHYATTQIATRHINLTFDEIQSDRIARLTGLVSHFVYWCVFGHVN